MRVYYRATIERVVEIDDVEYYESIGYYNGDKMAMALAEAENDVNGLSIPEEDIEIYYIED